MEIIPIVAHRFVKGEDLNHHGTLFAGRTAEWFVEAGLMAAAAYVPSDNIVLVKLHGMDFVRPVKLGEVARFVSRIVYAGRTSLIANIQISVGEERVSNGFITYVNVDSEGRKFPHGITIEAIDEDDIELQLQAKNL